MITDLFILLNFTQKFKLISSPGACFLMQVKVKVNLLQSFRTFKKKYIGVDSCVGHNDRGYGSIVIADLENLHFFEDNSIDIIVLEQVLECLQNPRVVLEVLNRF